MNAIRDCGRSVDSLSGTSSSLSELPTYMASCPMLNAATIVCTVMLYQLLLTL